MGLAGERVVIGIDGGGTHTRVMVSDLTGRVLAYVEKGAASLHKDLQARDNVMQAIREGLDAAGIAPRQVCGLAAGIAGYDSEADRSWVESLTALEELACPRWHVNDAIAAHYGALLMEPGIIAISGTGSIIVSMTEDGRYLRNYDYHHYAYSAARFIAYEAVYEALARRTGESDAALIEAMLSHWAVDSLDALHRLGAAGFGRDRRERDRHFGRFAPSLTEAALYGSALARRICDRAVDQLQTGIQLLGAGFDSEQVQVALIGSVMNSEYVSAQLKLRLSEANANKRYDVAAPRFTPATGAVLYAFRQLGLSASEDVVANLGSSPFTRT